MCIQIHMNNLYSQHLCLLHVKAPPSSSCGQSDSADHRLSTGKFHGALDEEAMLCFPRGGENRLIDGNRWQLAAQGGLCSQSFRVLFSVLTESFACRMARGDVVASACLSAKSLK